MCWIITVEHVFGRNTCFTERLWFYTNISFNLKLVVGLRLIQVSNSWLLSSRIWMSMTLLRGKILDATAIIEIDSRDYAVVQSSNPSNTFSLALVSIKSRLQSVSRKFGVALRSVLSKLLLLLIHLIIWISLCLGWQLFSLNTFKVLPIHIPTVAIHFHKSACLLVQQLQLNLIVVRNSCRSWITNACIPTRSADINLSILFQGCVSCCWSLHWYRGILLKGIWCLVTDCI